MCVYIYIYIHTHTHTHIVHNMCVYVYIHTHTHANTHTHILFTICVCVCVCVYIYIHTHIYCSQYKDAGGAKEIKNPDITESSVPKVRQPWSRSPKLRLTRRFANQRDRPFCTFRPGHPVNISGQDPSFLNTCSRPRLDRAFTDILSFKSEDVTACCIIM